MRRLTKSDHHLYKICDDCDDKVVNCKVEQEVKELLESKDAAFQEYKGQIENVMGRVAVQQHELEILENKVWASHCIENRQKKWNSCSVRGRIKKNGIKTV